MRINPKIYDIVEGVEPLDVQEFDNRKIEIYSLDNFLGVKEESINKGKFAVWSSADGINYRVFIEPGYYEELKPLYTAKINKIWVDFWDSCEKISKHASRNFIMPTTLISLVACIGVAFIPGNISFYLMIAVVAVAFLIMMFINKFTKKKMIDANVESVEEIKKILGQNNFDNLLEKQRNYMDKYYDELYPQESEDDLDKNDGADQEESNSSENDTHEDSNVIDNQTTTNSKGKKDEDLKDE